MCGILRHVFVTIKLFVNKILPFCFTPSCSAGKPTCKIICHGDRCVWVLKIVYKKRNPSLLSYNSDKTNFYSFVLGSLFSLIFCRFHEGSLDYFRQITTSAEVI